MENLISKCKSLIEAVNSRLISTENQRTKVEHTRLGLKKNKKQKKPKSLTCINEEHF